METANEYSTFDYCIASSLVSKGFSLKRIDPVSGSSRVSFVFDDSEDLQTILSLFWAKKLLVEPQTFHNAQKYLKSSIYERQNHGAF